MAQPQNVFYPAAPAAPTQNVTDFDVSAAALARRRRLAQMLQEQAITEGMKLPNPNARASWTNALAPLAQALAGRFEESRINEEEKKALADREAAAKPASEAFFNSFKGTTEPGQEAVPAIPASPAASGLAQQLLAPQGGAQPPVPPPPGPSGPAAPFGPDAAQQQGLAAQLLGPQPGQSPVPPTGPGEPTPTPPPPPGPPLVPQPPPGLDAQFGPAANLPGRPGQAAIPDKFIPPDPATVLAKANEYARVGGPAAQKIVDAMVPHITKNIMPSETATEQGIWVNPGGGRPGHFRQDPGGISPLLQQKADDARQAKIDSLQAQADRLAESARQANQTDATRRENASSRDAIMLQIAQIRQEGAAERAAQAAQNSKAFPTGQLDEETGHPIFRTPQGELRRNVGGKLEETPFGGNTIPSTSVEKEVPIAQGLNMTLARAKDTMKTVNDNPGAFGIGAKITGSLPFSASLKPQVFSQKELDAQVNVSRNAAALIKEFYGVAVSSGERSIVEKWVPQEGDSPELLAAKLKGISEWAEAKQKSLSTTSRAIAERRAGQTSALRDKYNLGAP